MPPAENPAPHNPSANHSQPRLVNSNWMAWLIFGAVCTLLSVAAIVIRVVGFPMVDLTWVIWFLERFMVPGLTVWWLTIGGVFEGFPGSGFGYTVVVFANVAVWLLVAKGLLAAAQLVQRWMRGQVDMVNK